MSQPPSHPVDGPAAGPASQAPSPVDPAAAPPAAPPDLPPPAAGEPGTPPTVELPINARPFGAAPARLTGRGPSPARRLVSPQEAAAANRKLSAEQKLLILDTWQRSGLPAGDFAELVGVNRVTLFGWKKRHCVPSSAIRIVRTLVSPASVSVMTPWEKLPKSTELPVPEG